MFITISGKLGSGKSTICDILSKNYGFEVFSTGLLHRELARKMNVNTLELNKLMRDDSAYDRLIDDEIVRLSEEKAKEDVIFDSRLAWHFVKKSFKVYTIIDPVSAARRVMEAARGVEEVYKNENEARDKLIERANEENVRFKEIYGVDNYDYSNYDLILDTNWSNAEELAKTVYDGSRSKSWTQSILLSPRSLYPTKTVRSVDRETLDICRKVVAGGDAIEPIEIMCRDGYHYVIDGHQRLLAALINKSPFIRASIADADDYPHFANGGNLSAALNAMGKKALYDYEEAGDFTYISYPEYYG